MLIVSGIMLYLTPLLMLIMYAGKWGYGWRYYISTTFIISWLSISFWLAYASGELKGT